MRVLEAEDLCIQTVKGVLIFKKMSGHFLLARASTQTPRRYSHFHIPTRFIFHLPLGRDLMTWSGAIK